MDDPKWEVIWEQFQIIFLFLERPVVLYQLVAFGVATGGAWLLSNGMLLLRQRLSKVDLVSDAAVTDDLISEAEETALINVDMPADLAVAEDYHEAQQPEALDTFQETIVEEASTSDKTPRTKILAQRFLLILQFIAFPILGLFILPLVEQIYDRLGWRYSLLATATLFFWLVLGYRLSIAVLYALYNRERISPYHLWLFGPLFWFWIASQLLDYLIDLDLLSQIQILDLLGTSITLGGLFRVSAILYFLFSGAWATQNVLQEVIIPRTSVDAGLIHAILTIGRYIVMSIGIMVVISTFEFDLTTLAFISGGLSVGLGFGLQQIFANLVSGILLLFEQSLRPGDIVELDGRLGTVQKLSIRATILQTFDNLEVIVPNESILTAPVTNYTKSNRIVRVLLNLGVSYKSNPREVLDLILDTAKAHELVRDDPEPVAFFTGFGPSSLDFLLAVWVDDPAYIRRVPSELYLNLWDIFAERGIEIPYPQQDIHFPEGLPLRGGRDD